MSVSRRIFYACLATLLVLVLSVVYRLSTVEPVNDLYFPFCGAKALLHSIDPYGGRCLIEWKGVIYPPNPMTTIFAAVPFMVAFGAGWGALLLWSSFTGLLVFGLLCDGQWWRL